MGSGSVALTSDVRVSLAGDRRTSGCGRIAVKLSTIDQLLAYVSEPLWVGQGAQGAVLKAQWRSGGCTVAVKWLVTSAVNFPAAYLEALLAKMLAHPFLVQTFEYGMCQLDDTFDRQQQPQQQPLGGQQEGWHQGEQQRDWEGQQEAGGLLLKSRSQPMCHYMVEGFGQTPAPSQQEQQQQQRHPGSKLRQTQPRPALHPPSCPHPLGTAAAGGPSVDVGVGGAGVSGLSDECGEEVADSGRCAGVQGAGVQFLEVSTRYTLYGGSTPTRPTQGGVVGASPEGPTTPDPWVNVPSSFTALVAAQQDSFDGNSVPAGSRPVDCVGVLRQLGASAGKYVVQIVSEWCDEGNLHAAIRRGVFRPQPPGPGCPGRSRTWAMRALLRTAREIAQGMCYLHSLNIIHGDLKPGNVLLKSSRIDSRGFVAKVADFGLSRLCNQREEYVATADWGTVPYMAGEYLDNRLCKSSDVYSFGVLLWQMYTGKAPFRGHLEAQVAVGVMMGDLQLEWPQNTPAPLSRLGQACCRHQHEQRPTFKEVVVALMGIETQVRDAHARSKLVMRRCDSAAAAASAALPARHGAASAAAAAGAAAPCGSLPYVHSQAHGVLLPTVAAGSAPLAASGPRLNQHQHPHLIYHYQHQQQEQQQRSSYLASGGGSGGGGAATEPALAPTRLLDACNSLGGRPAHSVLIPGTGHPVPVNVLRDMGSSELPAEAQSFVSIAGVDVVAPAPPVAVPAPPPPSWVMMQTSPAEAPLLQPQLSGRYMPGSTSRLQIRTSFADSMQPCGGAAAAAAAGDDDADASRCDVPEACSPRTLLGANLSTRRPLGDAAASRLLSAGDAAGAAPLPPPLPLPLPPATSSVVPSITHSSRAMDSPPGSGPAALVGPLPAGAVPGASNYSRAAAAAAAVVEKGEPPITPASAAAAALPPARAKPAAAVVVPIAAVVALHQASLSTAGGASGAADCPVPADSLDVGGALTRAASGRGWGLA